MAMIFETITHSSLLLNRKSNLPISKWMIHLVENSQQLTTISDMVTMATYTIRVLAFNARGDGPLSNPIHVKMQQGGKIEFEMVGHGGTRWDMLGLVKTCLDKVTMVMVTW